MYFSLPQDENVSIIVNIKNSSLIINFVAIFHSNNGIYGLMRRLHKNLSCEANNDEPNSISEILLITGVKFLKVVRI